MDHRGPGATRTADPAPSASRGLDTGAPPGRSRPCAGRPVRSRREEWERAPALLFLVLLIPAVVLVLPLALSIAVYDMIRSPYPGRRG